MEQGVNYKVLARKYRPATFADLIGQEALVRTLSNAIASGRIAQSYMLTGIRGVGKTTSARIIAKALNCVGKDGKGGMTASPCGECEHCRAIAEDRHVDVQEIDAASNTQVDNVREIIQSARYAPVSARFKVYIIDEVHMLSKSAANALLKLLEEPPERVKFIFATTEIRKVPVTILSRCQRFDLKRVDATVIADFFKKVSEKENVKITDEALNIIAKCADGSVRDGLSLLDQVIAHTGGDADAETLRAMLGLSDKTVIFSLFEALMKGDAVSVLSMVDEQKAAGADALMLLQDLSDVVYQLTKMKVNNSLLDDVTLSEELRVKGGQLAVSLSMAVLTRVWQMLLKGIEEVKAAYNTFSALEMVLIRIAYAADLPAPAELIKRIKEADTTFTPHVQTEIKKKIEPVITVTQKAPVIQETSVVQEDSADTVKPIMTLQDVVALARQQGNLLLALNIEKFLHAVKIENHILKVRAEKECPRDLPLELTKNMQDWTKEEWRVEFVSDIGDKTIKEQKTAREKELKDEVSDIPLVGKVLQTFAGANITQVVPVAKSVTSLGVVENLFQLNASDDGIGAEYDSDDNNNDDNESEKEIW